MVPVSALSGDGIDELLETLLLVADVQDPLIAASPDGRAAGVVLEANLDVGRGPVASVLVQRGTYGSANRWWRAPPGAGSAP